mmetsp:Transcript_27168/g.86313  ORF Transcript_27168/g.86313 Transcript_27168/m.86313 type:complete len:246 (+) Transcript_27168:1365-2102(+)
MRPWRGFSSRPKPGPMMSTRLPPRWPLRSVVLVRPRAFRETFRKYCSKSVKSIRFLPPAMASNTAFTRSKWPSSAMTPLLSTPGSRKSSTSWLCCTAAMSSSFEMVPLRSASMRSKISRTWLFSLCAASFAAASDFLRKYAAKCSNLIHCWPPAMDSKTASAASKLSSLLMSVPASTPGNSRSVTAWSLAMAAMSSSFETLPLALVSIFAKTSRSGPTDASSTSARRPLSSRALSRGWQQSPQRS